MMLFDESIKSQYTKKNYTAHLNQFMEFLGIKYVDQLLQISQQELQNRLEDYLIELKQTINPNTVPSKFQGIKHFCVMNQIDLNWNIIHKMFPPRKKTPNLRSYSTKEVKEILSNTTNRRNKALIHFLASTGARIGIFDYELSIKHIKKISGRCNAVKLYAGHVEEYWTFLTPQASKVLDAYHRERKLCRERFYEDTPIFSIRNTSKQLGWNGARSAIYRTISKSNIDRHMLDNRYDVQVDHGFRKRFNTILKLNNSVNYNIAEKLMGHKNGLDGVYLTPTLEELFAEFKKVIHRLEV